MRPAHSPCPFCSASRLLSIACRYVGGGSSGSGLSASVIDEEKLAEKIKAQGGKTVDEWQREQQAQKKAPAFQGSGSSIRGDSVRIDAPAPVVENKHTLHLWKNGIRCTQWSCAVFYSSVP